MKNYAHNNISNIAVGWKCIFKTGTGMFYIKIPPILFCKLYEKNYADFVLSLVTEKVLKPSKFRNQQQQPQQRK